MTPDPPGGAASRQRLETVIRGRVQGVGFRMFASRSAAVLSLVGWVANEPDGSVRVVAEGPRSALEAFARELSAGPSGSVVDRIDTTWSAATGTFDRFAMRSGWHGGD